MIGSVGRRLGRRSRGRCPRCGDREVVHLVIGLPTAQALASAPEWVSFVGCMTDGVSANRRCDACGQTWAA